MASNASIDAAARAWRTLGKPKGFIPDFQHFGIENSFCYPRKCKAKSENGGRYKNFRHIY